MSDLIQHGNEQVLAESAAGGVEKTSGGERRVEAVKVERVLAVATPNVPAETGEPSELTEKQANVLEKLSIGMSITDISRAVHISRNTVYRWLNDEPVFRAAYNRWKRVCAASVETRLLALMDTAVDVIREQLDVHRDGRLAMKLLERLSMIKPVILQAANAESSKQEIKAEQLMEKGNLARFVGEAKEAAEGGKEVGGWRS